MFKIIALCEEFYVLPSGEIKSIPEDREWRDVANTLNAEGATHIFNTYDTTSPGGAGCLMPTGLMTMTEFMEQAKNL